MPRLPSYRPVVINLHLRIETMTTSEAQAIVAAIEALPAQFASSNSGLQTQLDAANAALATEKQDHAEDLTAIQTAVQQITPGSGSTNGAAG